MFGTKTLCILSTRTSWFENIHQILLYDFVQFNLNFISTHKGYFLLAFFIKLFIIGSNQNTWSFYYISRRFWPWPWFYDPDVHWPLDAIGQSWYRDRSQKPYSRWLWFSSPSCSSLCNTSWRELPAAREKIFFSLINSIFFFQNEHVFLSKIYHQCLFLEYSNSLCSYVWSC